MDGLLKVRSTSVVRADDLIQNEGEYIPHSCCVLQELSSSFILYVEYQHGQLVQRGFLYSVVSCLSLKDILDIDHIEG